MGVSLIDRANVIDIKSENENKHFVTYEVGKKSKTLESK